jgi:hypothetical protein
MKPKIRKHIRSLMQVTDFTISGSNWVTLSWTNGHVNSLGWKKNSIDGRKWALNGFRTIR